MTPASQQVPQAIAGERKNPWRFRQSLIFRIALTAAALVFWFWTQALIGSRTAPVSGIVDRVHSLTAEANSYLGSHAAVADALLISSSAIIDLLGIFLLSRWIFWNDPRPFLGLVIVLGLRQIMQACVSLPAPPGFIWRNPGFPSLLVTYGVSNDYFFSGHTAIAVLGATEMARFRRPWLVVVGVAFVLFEIATVLVLRAHYTMDVFTGLIAGLYSAYVADRVVRWGRG